MSKLVLIGDLVSCIKGFSNELGSRLEELAEKSDSLTEEEKSEMQYLLTLGAYSYVLSNMANFKKSVNINDSMEEIMRKHKITMVTAPKFLLQDMEGNDEKRRY
ncbi:MAG: hypothetical protein ACRDD8_12975 [Bacteroidales bacterium]